MILLKSKVGKYILKHVKASLTEGKSIILDAFALLGGNENLVYKIMVELAQQHPGYGWETNAGYPSKSHKAALQDLGVTPHHRRSFRPVYNILYQDKLLRD